MDKLTATLQSIGTLTCSITATNVIRATIKSEDTLVAHVSAALGDFDVYEGDYSVVPSITPQTLNTKYKSMEDDVEVESIPYQEVTNVSGGKTATIGGY